MKEQKGYIKVYILRFENSFWQNLFLFISLRLLQNQIPVKEFSTVWLNVCIFFFLDEVPFQTKKFSCSQ